MHHHYKITLNWTGNLGTGTSGYRKYSRNHEIHVEGKPPIPGSSDPSFRGDPQRYNPEEQLVASLSSCHMLWYLHLCADAGIIVLAYNDQAEGTMKEMENGSGAFESVTLKPIVQISDVSRMDEAASLHKKANEMCFIANSVNFPVKHEAQVEI